MDIPLRALEAQRLIRQMPYFERRLWKRLNSAVHKLAFEPKAFVADHMVDFYCHEAKVIIELVGNGRYPPVLHNNQQFINRGFTVYKFPEPRSEVDVNNIVFRLHAELSRFKKRVIHRTNYSSK